MSFVLPAAKAAKTLLGSGSEISKEITGYDFIGLTMKLLIFYLVAMFASWYFKLAIGGENVLGTFLSFIGVKVPNNTNTTLAKLFSDDGFGNGITYWRIIQFVSIALVLWEAIRYYEQNKKNSNAITLAIFGLIIGFLLLTSLPQFLQKIKETQILKKAAA